MKSPPPLTLLCLIVGLATLPNGCEPNRTHQDTGYASACGLGTIAFRAPTVHEKRFQCGEGSWYDEGYRDYVARLSQPARSSRMTLVLVHQQITYGASGVLLTRQVQARNPRGVTLQGRIDFSSVYGVSGPAGAPPFGAYTLSIHRGPSAHGRLLAKGTFTVIED